MIYEQKKKKKHKNYKWKENNEIKFTKNLSSALKCYLISHILKIITTN